MNAKRYYPLIDQERRTEVHGVRELIFTQLLLRSGEGDFGPCMVSVEVMNAHECHCETRGC